MGGDLDRSFSRINISVPRSTTCVFNIKTNSKSETSVHGLYILHQITYKNLPFVCISFDDQSTDYLLNACGSEMYSTVRLSIHIYTIYDVE